MAYRAIADNEIDAYSPVTARLMAAYNNNMLGVAIRLLSLPGKFTHFAYEDVTYADLGTWSLYIPPISVGVDGTRLYLPTYMHVAVAAGDEATLFARWKIGSAYSTAWSTSAVGYTLGASSTTVTYLTVDSSLTGNTVQQITIQGYANNVIGTASAGLDDTSIRGYIAPLPSAGGY